jgi:hypothetical protein
MCKRSAISLLMMLLLALTLTGCGSHSRAVNISASTSSGAVPTPFGAEVTVSESLDRAVADVWSAFEAKAVSGNRVERVDNGAHLVGRLGDREIRVSIRSRSETVQDVVVESVDRNLAREIADLVAGAQGPG